MKYTFRSPGRINLIGEHTDYNGGYVLPAAIDKYTYITFEESDHFEVYSKYFDQRVRFSFDEKKEKVEWVNYVKGAVLYSLKGLRREVKPWKIEISGDLPMGAGLSSSASLIVGIVYALSRLGGVYRKREKIIKIAQRVESEFVGVKCGIMDQYAVTLGKKGNFMLIDTERKWIIQYVRALNFPKITVIDSGVKHKLALSEYNKRRNECERAEEIIGTTFKRMDIQMLEEKKNKLGETLYKRARHVVEENNRVWDAVFAIGGKDWAKLGHLLYESHESLKSLYEVSTDETDFIVERLGKIKSVYGARMIGGGFGGSVLVISKEYLDDDLKELSKEYKRKFGIDMKFYHIKLASGVRRI